MKAVNTRFRAYQLGSPGSSFSYFADGHFIHPKLAICSSDYDNQYDHPREEIRELHERKIRLMTTKTGDVVVMSIGNHTGWCRAVNLKAGSTEVSSTFDFYSKKAGLLDYNADTQRQLFARRPSYPR